MTREMTKIEYTFKEGDESVVGILASFIPDDLVPNPRSSAMLCENEELQVIMQKLDDGICVRRASSLGNDVTFRQLTPYILMYKADEHGVQFASHRLKDSGLRCLGLEGRTTWFEQRPHQVEEGNIPFVPVISSYWSALYAGMAVLNTVDFDLRTTEEQTTATNLIPCGIISDYHPEEEGYPGNQKLGVVGLIKMPGNMECTAPPSRYEPAEWLRVDEVLSLAGEYDEWSKLLMPLFRQMEELIHRQGGFDEPADEVAGSQPSVQQTDE